MRLLTHFRYNLSNGANCRRLLQHLSSGWTAREHWVLLLKHMQRSWVSQHLKEMQCNSKGLLRVWTCEGTQETIYGKLVAQVPGSPLELHCKVLRNP